MQKGKIEWFTLIFITLWLFFLWDIYSTLRDFNFHDYMRLVCDPFDTCIFSKTLILDHEAHLELIFLIKHALLFVQNVTILFFLQGLYCNQKNILDTKSKLKILISMYVITMILFYRFRWYSVSPHIWSCKKHVLKNIKGKCFLYA